MSVQSNKVDVSLSACKHWKSETAVGWRLHR